MSKEEIRGKVKSAIANVCGMDATEIGDDAHFVDDLGLDSLSVIEAFVDLEREFKIAEATEEAESRLVSIGTAVEYIQEQLNTQAA
jgi:acyl carrier protein